MKRQPIIYRGEVLLLAFLVLVLFGLSRAHTVRPAFSSAELKFTDSSAHGLAIVPASCPSHPHFAGDCGVISCAASISCLNSTTVHSVDASCNVQNTVCPTGWSCGAGACVPPPNPDWSDWTITLPNGSTATADGHFQARPALLRSGATTQLYWNTTHVSSCTVSDDYGHTWSGMSSAASGQTSDPLTGKTTFVLDCPPLAGSSASHIHETVVVNIAPIFQEQ